MALQTVYEQSYPPVIPRDEANDPRTPDDSDAQGFPSARLSTPPSALTERTMRWARRTNPAEAPLRRGAWYPVFSTTSEEVGIIVHGRAIIVRRSSVDIRGTPPNRWTLVTQDSGSSYIVCPRCAERVPARIATGSWVASATCLRCQGTFTVEMPGVASTGGIARRPSDPDLRRGERRERREPQRVERRWGKERRASWRAYPPLFDDFTTP
jgi:hypothetical protein